MDKSLYPGLMIPCTYSFPLIGSHDLPFEFGGRRSYRELLDSLYTLSFEYYLPLYS